MKTRIAAALLSMALVGCSSGGTGGTGGGAGGGTSGVGGGGGGDAGGTGGTGGSGGGDSDGGFVSDGGSDLDSGVDHPPPCTNGTDCDLMGKNGVCAAMTCAACAGDAGCQSAYGQLYGCYAGSCSRPAGSCSTSDACPPGQLCVNGACNALGLNACQSAAVGDACSSGGRCCTRMGALTCVDVECCTAAQCPGSNMECQAGSCVATGSGCSAPPDGGGYWVDPAYTGTSTGSNACPFKTLHGAFHAVRTDDEAGETTVRIKPGTINSQSEGGASYFPLTVPAGTFVRTPDGQTPAVIVAPADTTAFEIPYTTTSPTTLRNLEIKQASRGTAGAGVNVTGGSAANPVDINHVTIYNFRNGINVGAGGRVTLNWGVVCRENDFAGLRVAGGRVDVVVGSLADQRTVFNLNGQNGIYVSDDPASALVVNGAELADGGLKSVAANSNTSNGLRLYSSNAANSISDMGFNDNGASSLVLYGGSTLKARRLNIQTSGGSGVHVLDNGSKNSRAGIDFGTSNDFGRNTFSNNTDSHICNSTSANSSVMFAEGNTFGAVDCSVANPSGNLRFFDTCLGHGGGVNANGGSLWVAVSIANCNYSF